MWEKINEPFKIILEIQDIVQSKKRVTSKLWVYFLLNSKKILKAFENIKFFAGTIPIEDPAKLKIFVQNFNTYFDLEDDKKEQKIEATLLLIVEIYKWLKIVQ